MTSQVGIKTKRKYKPKEITLEYHYVEPKTPQEKLEQQKRIDGIFDVIFEETIKFLKKKNNCKSYPQNKP